MHSSPYNVLKIIRKFKNFKITLVYLQVPYFLSHAPIQNTKYSFNQTYKVLYVWVVELVVISLLDSFNIQHNMPDKIRF